MDHERFTFLASARAADELMERIENRQKYMPETVEASLAELQQRGKHFSDEELTYIAEDMQARRRNVANASNRASVFNPDFKHAIVKDPDAPSLYSRRVLYPFTVFMSPLFGSVMMAININKTEKKQGIWIMLLFGIVSTALLIFIASRVEAKSTRLVELAGGIAGAYAINYYFWNRYIGNTTFYRVKMAWVPLIIALAILALFIAAIVYGDNHPQY